MFLDAFEGEIEMAFLEEVSADLEPSVELGGSKDSPFDAALQDLDAARDRRDGALGVRQTFGQLLLLKRSSCQARVLVLDGAV